MLLLLKYEILLTIIGWMGVVLCTAAYLLLSIKAISAEHMSFQLLNIVGSLFLMTGAIFTDDLPNFAADLLWMCVGLFAIGRRLRSKRQRRNG